MSIEKNNDNIFLQDKAREVCSAVVDCNEITEKDPEIGWIKDRNFSKLLDVVGGELSREIKNKIETGTPSIIEIGLGKGDALEELSSKYPNAKVFGTDLFIQEGIKKACYGDAQHLPFQKNVFDFLYSIHCFQYVSDKLQFLSEVMRVLKSDGLGIIVGSDILGKYSDPPINELIANNFKSIKVQHLKKGDDLFIIRKNKEHLQKRHKFQLQDINLRVLGEGSYPLVTSIYKKRGWFKK